jgi:membrane associated rhomboid family serine protease
MWSAGNGDINRVALAFGEKNNALIRAGQYWRFLTPLFLHGSLPHLLTNSISLIWLGAQMEQIYGSRRYFLIYMVAGIAGNIASFLFNPGPSLGASGAIFGLVGAGLIFPLRFWGLVPKRARFQILSQLTIVTVVNLGIGFQYGSYIDNAAHVGGLLGGGLAALFLIPEALERGPRRRWNEAWLSASIAAILLALGWAGVSQWRWGTQWEAAHRLPPMMTYSPSGDNPWWSIQLPNTWKQAEGGWRSPKGAMVRVMDMDSDPQALLRLVNMVQQQGQKAASPPLDGKPAWHIALQSPQGMTDLYLIHAYNRWLAIALECPPNLRAASLRDFALMVNSVRFIHPPDANVP